jgi:hypothetical protein
MGMTLLRALLYLGLFLLGTNAIAQKCEALFVQDDDKRLEEQDARPIQRYKRLGNLYGGKFWDDSYTEEWLNKAVIENPTGENFLANLPGSLRRSHTLGINSKSTQFGSADKPRVIMSNSDSTFMLTFSGDPKQRGYKTLEAVIFDRATSEFIPYEIEIDADGKLKSPKKKPEKCMGCHGESFRPIWSAYPFWPRFYGSFKAPTSAFTESLNQAEKTAFDHFIENERNSGRYSYLIGNKTHDEIEYLNSSLTLNIAQLNILRISKSVQKMKQLRPEIGSLIKFAVSDLADKNRAPRDFKNVLDAETANLYEQEINRLVTNTSECLSKGQIKDISDHLSAFKMDQSPVSPETVWTADIGVVHNDANVAFHNYRTSEENIKKMNEYIMKIANLRFVVEVLGNTPLSEWSMSSAHDPEGLPFYSTPLDTAWKDLLVRLQSNR